MFKFFSNNEKISQIMELAIQRGRTGGLSKRIDENREMVEFFLKNEPEIFSKYPWVLGWLSLNDTFFTELQEILKLEMPKHRLPRDWPGQPGLSYNPPNPKKYSI